MPTRRNDKIDPIHEHDETERLYHELQVHQIELEMQNEELRRIQAELTASRDRFSVLFHNASVGLVVLDKNGMIQEANDTFCRI
ncbi:MAG: PAS domain-containing protein, partial [Desulfatirhabdiaceae bacterium]